MHEPPVVEPAVEAAPEPVVPAPSLTVEISREIDPQRLAAAKAGLDNAKADIAAARAKIAAAKRKPKPPPAPAPSDTEAVA
jgi:hypothetical protein